MEGQKPSPGLYPEPPPPYSQDPHTNAGYSAAPTQYSAAATPQGKGIYFQPMPQQHQQHEQGHRPQHAPPPGGVPVFPMAGYPPPPPGQTVVMGAPTPGQMSSVTVVSVAQWGPYPMQIGCPHCGAQVMTETTASPGLLTWLLAGALIFFGCWIGCCLIPCCIPECQDIEHRCPNCKQHLGSYRRL